MDLLKRLFSVLGLAEMIGGAFVDTLFSTGSRLWKVEEEAEKLRRTETRIRAVLTDAEQRRFIDDDFIKLWLQELRAAAFDVDALLDRLSTAAAMSKMAAAETARKRKRLWLKTELGLRQRWELDAWIARINERLDEIDKDRKRYRLQAGDGRRTAAPPMQRPRLLEAAAHRDERPIGRTREKDEIIRALISDTSVDLPVLSIWGTAGIGKTALARMVYTAPEVENFFTDKIWVWLPDVCDVRVATKMIIEAVTRQKCDLLSLDILQQRLREHLCKRKFLLVIDNIWAKGFQFWEFLRPSLAVGDKGSKVLITTQDERVSKMMSNILNIHLEGLEEKECWEILKVNASSGWNSNDQHDFDLIGERIAANCRGSPLAAKSLGMLLSDANGYREQLESILSDVQFLEDDRNTDIILASLQISYQHLPYQLKQCFAFCSMYPPDFEFEKDELLRLWMADGIVKSNGRKRVELDAAKFFDVLLWRSFFETLHTFPNQKFRVPNLMLDVARRVSRYESVTLDAECSQVSERPEWVRYATIVFPADQPLALDKIYHYENLRLLKLCPTMKLPSKHVQVPSALFSKFSCLRTLDLSDTELDALPDSIGCSAHLRYLSLRNTSIKALPETVCNLFNLQTLDLNDCYQLMDLPEGLNRLVNLRHLCLHLDWDKVTPFRSMPSGIDKLESLQTLSRFVVVSKDEGKCNINELKNLKIRGELCILNLEAASHDGAMEANMISKEYLHKLMLKWSEVFKDEQEQHIEDSERIIEALCPQANLKHLHIENYPGGKLPSWVNTLSSLDTLEIISCPRLTQFSVETLPFLKNFRIHQCADLAVLPKGLCNLERLRYLEIRGAPNLRISAVDILPRNITRLVVSECDALENWCRQEGAEIVQQIPHTMIQFGN